MAGQLGLIAQSAEVRGHLHRYIDTLQGFQNQYMVLVQRFQAVPARVRECAEISEQDRVICAIELWPMHASRQLPSMFDWHTQAATNVQVALNNRNLENASWGLRVVEVDVVVLQDFLGHIEAAVGAHEQVEKMLRLRDQLNNLMDCLDGFAKVHSHLQDRYRALDPSIQDSPLVRVYSRIICDEEFDEAPVEQSHLATTMGRLDAITKNGYRDLMFGDLEGAERAVNAAEGPMPSINAQLQGLEAAVDEHVRAQDFAAVQAQQAYQVLTGDGMILRYPTEDDQPRIPSYTDFVDDAPAQALRFHHPSPITPAGRIELAKWMDALPAEDQMQPNREETTAIEELNGDVPQRHNDFAQTKPSLSSMAEPGFDR